MALGGTNCLAGRIAVAVAASVIVTMSLAGNARAQATPGPSGETPRPPQEDWAKLSDEELFGTQRSAPRPREPEPPPAVEPTAPTFGAPGELVITGDASIGISSTSYPRSDASSFLVGFSPGLDVFVLRGFSVGGDVTMGYSSSRGYGAGGELVETRSSTFGGGPRLGVNVRLGASVTWYPRVTVGVESVRLDVTDSSTSTFDPRPSRSTDTALFVSAFAPILFHPVPHFFIGLGPGVRHAFGGAQGGPQDGVERTTFSGRFVLGAWWGGSVTEPEASDLAPPSSAIAPRFAERGQCVFTGEVGGAISRTDRSGVGASTAASVAPGFDCFVGARVSVGVNASARWSDAIFKAPSGKVTTIEVTRAALGVRLGIDQPLSSTFSFYPRATISVGRELFDERSGTQRNETASTVVSLGLYAPVLVHVATHAFAGVGPVVSRDVIRSTDGRVTEPLATVLGANLVVGAWL